eukprot:gene35866-46556_t
MLFVAIIICTFFHVLHASESSEKSEVVILNSSNFEHLTQISTGSTTGDWFVKFYAPWCGHCKTLAPAWEEIAQSLLGEVNVAKVDVPANQDLGRRFEIKGFPTLKLFSKGKSYTYKGKRDAESLIAFAKGGYKDAEEEKVEPPKGFFGEIIDVFSGAAKRAYKSIQKGKYFTPDLFLIAMPLVVLILMIVLFLFPVPDEPRRAPVKKVVAEPVAEKED